MEVPPCAFPVVGGVLAVLGWLCQPDGRQNNPGCPVVVSIPDQMIEFNYR